MDTLPDPEPIPQGEPPDFYSALLAWRARYAAEIAEDEARDGVYIDPFADVRDRRRDGGRPPIDFDALMGEEPHPAP